MNSLRKTFSLPNLGRKESKPTLWNEQQNEIDHLLARCHNNLNDILGYLADIKVAILLDKISSLLDDDYLFDDDDYFDPFKTIGKYE